MTSNISQFYKKTRVERLDLLKESGFLDNDSLALLNASPLLTEDVANSLIENQLAQFPLPLGVALNFIVDNKDVVVPMVVEEPSVIAAASNGAKFMRKHGGFITKVHKRALIGQIILTDIIDFQEAAQIIERHRDDIFEQTRLAHPSIVKRGGGLEEIDIRVIKNERNEDEFLTIHLIVNVKDAMGANIVNTILETVSQAIQKWLDAECLMSILSNFNDHSLVTSRCRVATQDLASSSMSGLEVAKKIVAATRYAQLDPYRAATHNKGIMNGIDSVLIATGNDSRAVEAGAHAYAARDGQYRSMSRWSLDEEGFLNGELTLPMPVGSVGGAISVLPLAKTSQQLMKAESALDIAKIVTSVGLAQNFSALKALVSEGIQRGHMSLHAKSLAIHVGAVNEEIDLLSEKLRLESTMNSEIASRLLQDIRKNK
ncbi:hydroxymethylglutaryl-CoA reductase, degradative [Vagococcus intermedius]|uniref:3-hydroxy-3-methylglutaryl coenzyme A reductase n=1 Tax=Vagococcus intermedius TaxID=2991418 RepID=A0AAF0I7V2_9ENTE|nr:hydroxymethylglutaryl-CoA reductase, degradative [Vagococcus intermedius]WEG73665.1 hydroxymethylglutaryl-CoA reductase, degradative [Vagococcus intermedius]WEG75749.1 hydroxymethylglutaryl-CoA reductase, degradative [Vagococcus intermedius]